MRFRHLLFFAATHLVVPSSAYATQVIATNLSAVVDHAGLYFIGTCLDRKVERRSEVAFPKGYLMTTYTFRVSRWLKAGGTHASSGSEVLNFSQWGGSQDEDSTGVIIGLPQYEVGREYVLFLIPRSASTGLTSPVGLGQGVFDVRVQPDGSKLVKNAFFTSGLLSELPSTAKIGKALSQAGLAEGANKGALPLNQFLQIVEALSQPEKSGR